jgi:hypothetical protein
MDLSRWQTQYNGFRNRGDMRSLESELKKATDDLRVAANKQQRDMANARIRLLNNHIRNLNITRVIGPVTAESLRPGPATQAVKRFGQLAQQARQTTGSSQNAGAGQREAVADIDSRERMDKDLEALRRRGSSTPPSGSYAAGPLRAEGIGGSGGRGGVTVTGGNTGPSQGGALARIDPPGPVAIPSRGGGRSVMAPGGGGGGVAGKVADVADDVIDAEIVTKGGELFKRVKRFGKWALIPIAAGAALLARDSVGKKGEQPKFTPDVVPPAPNKPAAVAEQPKAYPAQGQMSKAMGVARDSTGQVDKMNPADVKKAQGYMTDLMQRIGKGGWDEPGQERRGIQIGTPGSDKIVQMFKNSQYSDQFTRAEQEEAIKRFKANFAKQSFKGRNVTPAGRSVTPTAQYTGSPERY